MQQEVEVLANLGLEQLLAPVKKLFVRYTKERAVQRPRRLQLILDPATRHPAPSDATKLSLWINGWGPTEPRNHGVLPSPCHSRLSPGNHALIAQASLYCRP